MRTTVRRRIPAITGHSSWAAFALLLLSYAHVSLAADPTPPTCPLRLYATIDLLLTENEAFVPVSVNAHTGVMNLALNLPLSLVHASNIGALGLFTREVEIPRGQGLTRPAIAAYIKSLHVGDADFGANTFILDDRKPRHVATGEQDFGSLGMDAFSTVDIELDLAHRKLRLFSQDHCPGKVVYWADDWGSAPLFQNEIGAYYFPVELEGKKVQAALAPDEAFSRLSTDVTRRLYGFDKESPGVETIPGQRGDKTEARFRAMQLTAPSMTVKNTLIRLTDPVKGCGLSIDHKHGDATGYNRCPMVFPMVVGRNVLQKLRLYLATKEKVLYFTLADVPPAKRTDTTPAHLDATPSVSAHGK